MLPKEHGAYGQMAFPLLAAFIAGGVSAAGVLFAATVIALFVAHEPASVLLGGRGVRARREQGARARRWLAGAGSVAVIAGIAAIAVMPPPARLSLLLPAASCLVLLAVALTRGEKSWQGEVMVAITFATAAVPVYVAGEGGLAMAIAIAIPFALLFICGTLAVRVVILRVRGGGDPIAARRTRTAALALSAGSVVVLAALVAGDVLPAMVLLASAPGLLLAAAVAAVPPHPTSLRRIGWALVAASMVTLAVIVAA